MHVRDVPLGRKFLPKPGRIVRVPGKILLRCDACVICFSWARSLLVGLSIDALLVWVPSTRRVTSSLDRRGSARSSGRHCLLLLASPGIGQLAADWVPYSVEDLLRWRPDVARTSWSASRAAAGVPHAAADQRRPGPSPRWLCRPR